MNDESTPFQLRSRDGASPAPVLTGVQALGRLDGVIFELTLSQTYRNTTSEVLEVVYTFPLPHEAVLLGFASELNGERSVGTVVARAQAEQRYEGALAQGDAPVMLEALGGGLHTANIGNLQPGDELTLELRFARLLSFEQGRLRVSIPTTIAPRYGSAEQAGLQPQQVPQASLSVDYPLSLAVEVSAAWSGSALSCPTHRMVHSVVDGGQRLALEPGARLDRDVVIVVEPREVRPSLVVQGHDPHSSEAPVVAMVAMQAPAAVMRDRIALKLLVDCSGSMAGDSMESARRALHGVLAQLSTGDGLSLTRFGSQVDAVLPPIRWSPRLLATVAAQVDAIEADLGGTEMQQALESVIAQRWREDRRKNGGRGSGQGRDLDDSGADVFLITDGEIWQTEETIAAAKSTGHRVFVLGVGSSPAEGVLRSLAEATGGACEFATPGEALEGAARRMLARIRQQPWSDVRVQWGPTAQPAWETRGSRTWFAGDTLLAMAGLSAPVTAGEVRLLGVDAQGRRVELARGEAVAPCPGDTLARMAASRRMAQVEAEDESSLELALTYQLMGSQTHCILVHERAEGQKTQAQARLHRVESMLAAGWGATSSVDYTSLPTPSVWRSTPSLRCAPGRDLGLDPVGSVHLSVVHDMASPAFSLAADSPPATPATLELIARAVEIHLAQGGALPTLAAHCAPLQLPADTAEALAQARALGALDHEAWLLLAHWVNVRPHGLGDASLTRVLQPHVAAVDADLLARCLAMFDRQLAAQALDDVRQARSERLQRAVSSS